MGGFVTFCGESLGERFSATGDEPAGEGAGAGHGDLLAEHRTEGEFGAVHAPWYAPARRTENERAEKWVGPEHVGDGDRVGVEVENTAATLYRATEVPQVLEPEHTPNVVAAVGEGHDAGAVWQTQGPPVGLPIESLYAGYSASAKQLQHTVRVNGLLNGSRSGISPRTISSCTPRPRRSSLGATAKTSRIVSLNWRTLVKPAA